MDVFKFEDLVPAGKHYFYFVKDSQFYCLSDKYDVVLYPGTNLKMNTMDV